MGRPTARQCQPQQANEQANPSATHSRLPTPSLMCEGERAAQPHLMGALSSGSAPAEKSAM